MSKKKVDLMVVREAKEMKAQPFGAWKQDFKRVASLAELEKLLFSMPIAEYPEESLQHIQDILGSMQGYEYTKIKGGEKVTNAKLDISFIISENDFFELGGYMNLESVIILALSKNCEQWIGNGIPLDIRKKYEPIVRVLTEHSFQAVKTYVEKHKESEIPQVKELDAMIWADINREIKPKDVYEMEGYRAELIDSYTIGDKEDDSFEQNKDSLEEISYPVYVFALVDPSGEDIGTTQYDSDVVRNARLDAHAWYEEERFAEHLEDGSFAELRALKECLKNYATIGYASDTELFFKMLREIPPAYLTRDLGKVFMNVEPDKSFEKLVTLMRDTKDPHERAQYGRVLSVMVDAKIPIFSGNFSYDNEKIKIEENEEQRLRYLKRISRENKMAVFNDQEKLCGFISQKEKKKQLPLEPITSEMLSSGHHIVTDEEIGEFCGAYVYFFKTECVALTGIDMSALSLREQFGLYTFWKKTKDGDEKKWKSLWNMMNLCGVEALKVAIGMEYDGNLLEKAQTFAFDREIPREVKRELFEQYGSIMERLDTVEKDVEQFFIHQNIAVPFHEITRQLSERGYQVLVRSIDTIKKNKNDLDRARELLKKFETDVVLFSSLFSSFFKGKEMIDFEDINGLDFSEQRMADLSEITKKQMRLIAEENWNSRGNAGKEVFEEFEKTLESTRDIRFYTLYKDNALIAFIRFEPVLDGEGEPVKDHVYAGSFNVHPSYRGSAIGEAMLARVLDKESEGAIIEATVSPKLVVGTDYIEKRKFVIDKVLPNYDGSDETFFSIVLDKELNKTLESKVRKETQLLDLQREMHRDQSFESLVGRDEVVREYDIDIELDAMTNETDFFTTHGFVGARYRYDKGKPSRRMIVFEKIKTK